MCFHIVFRIVNNYVSWTVCVLIRIYKPLCLEMSFVIEYYGCADNICDNCRDRARKHERWVKFRGPWAKDALFE